MPTNRHRHMITETENVAQALEVAAEAWPEHRGDKGALLKMLLATGKESLESKKQLQRIMRIQAIQEAANKFEGVWPSNWREEVQGEWPE